MAKENLRIKSVEANEFEVKLHFLVSDSIIDAPFASTLQDRFKHCTIATSRFAREPLSYTEHDSSMLFRWLGKGTSFSHIPMHSVLLSNVITHTHTSAQIAVHSPVFSLANALFVSVLFNVCFEGGGRIRLHGRNRWVAFPLCSFV